MGSFYKANKWFLWLTMDGISTCFWAYEMHICISIGNISQNLTNYSKEHYGGFVCCVHISETWVLPLGNWHCYCSKEKLSREKILKIQTWANKRCFISPSPFSICKRLENNWYCNRSGRSHWEEKKKDLKKNQIILVLCFILCLHHNLLELQFYPGSDNGRVVFSH